MIRRLFALLLLSATPPAIQAAEFIEKSSQNGTSYILLEGEIRDGDTERLEAILLAGKADSRMIAFNSPGGSLWEGELLGRILRYRGFSTYIRPGEQCLSACLFAFIGGEQRFVYPGGKLGGHQFYGGEERAKSQDFTQYSTAELFKFAREMGISSEVIEIASRTPPDKMHIYTEDELRTFKLSIPHKPVSFQEREARRLKIKKSEYQRRWAKFLASDLGMCTSLGSYIARDSCINVVMNAYGIPR